MEGILATLAAALGIVKEWLGIQNKKVDLRNTEEMKEREGAAQEQAEKDKAREAVRTGNIEEIRKAVSVLLAAAAIGAAGLLCSCASTITPKPVTGASIAFDGTNQNAGIWTELPGSGHCYLISAGARDRYNALIDTYGAAEKPPTVRDAGLTPTGTNTWIAEPEAMVNFWLFSWKDRQTPHRPK